MELATTLLSAAFYGVMGAYALLAMLAAGGCLGAALAVLARDVTHEIVGELTFGVKPPTGR